MRHPHRISALTAVALSTALALGACGAHVPATGAMDHGSVGTVRPTTPVASSPAASGDVMFAQMMIPHHEQAVAMADLALERAGTSDEVRRLAQQIRGAQAPEIATMTAWLEAWGAPTAATRHMDHGTDGMMSEADMTVLAAAEGATFERTWLTMMIAHHEGAVTMSRTVLATTADPDVHALAKDIIAAQEQEITTMRALTS